MRKKLIGKRITKPESKICITCGRLFENRKRWSGRDMWEKIKYCSRHCRKMKDSIIYK